MRHAILGLLTCLVLLSIAPSVGATGARRPTHGHRRHAGKVLRRPPVADRRTQTPTCRYADGTPFDPDIIGGPNHVGDGGPAANLGGSDPCGY